MNKTVSINLGGIFFHIDEMAYQKLQHYLDAIRQSLSNDPRTNDEILSDIELRIRELLTEMIKTDRQVVCENDIDKVIRIMGKPEDYQLDETLFEDSPKASKTPNKKLFRDGEDAFLGGVCAGLAHYLGVDVSGMRIFWLLCSFAFGVGFLVYFLLWILVPEAKTTADKLQMKGEAVNIVTIEKKIREEFQNVTTQVKEGVQDLSEKMKNTDIKGKAQSGFHKAIHTLGKLLSVLFAVLGKLIGSLIIIITACIIISLFVGAFSVGSFELLSVEENLLQYPPFFFASIQPFWLVITYSLLLLGIPFVGLFILGVKIVSGSKKSIGNTAKLVLLGLWVISLLALLFEGIYFSTRTAYKGVSVQKETLRISNQDTLRIKMVTDDTFSVPKTLRNSTKKELVYHEGLNKLYRSTIYLDIEHTDKPTPYIKIRKWSESSSTLNADIAAKDIHYEYDLKQGTLSLNAFFLSSVNDWHKDQRIDISLYLPTDVVIYLNKSTRSFLKGIDNTQHLLDTAMPKHYFKMSDNGLDCMDCGPALLGDKDLEDKLSLKIDKKGVRIRVESGEEPTAITLDKNGIHID